MVSIAAEVAVTFACPTDCTITNAQQISRSPLERRNLRAMRRQLP
jgi:hypothetical protein